MTYDTNIQFDSECNECRSNEKYIQKLNEDNLRLYEALKQAKEALIIGIQEIKAMRSVLLSNPSDDDGIARTLREMESPLDTINKLL